MVINLDTHAISLIPSVKTFFEVSQNFLKKIKKKKDKIMMINTPEKLLRNICRIELNYIIVGLVMQ